MVLALQVKAKAAKDMVPKVVRILEAVAARDMAAKAVQVPAVRAMVTVVTRVAAKAVQAQVRMIKEGGKKLQVQRATAGRLLPGLSTKRPAACLHRTAYELTFGVVLLGSPSLC